MEQLLPHFHGDPDAVCEALGVSKREFNLSVRTLALVKAYKDSDYGDQLQSEQYNLFREVLKSEPMRAWLGLGPHGTGGFQSVESESAVFLDVARSGTR